MDELRDDRITLDTRIIGALVVFVLLLAFVALYVFPEMTDWDFAWTILPRTSAILIGAGYTAGAYFFARLVTAGRWHRFKAGFWPITAFTVCMLLATLLHMERFHQGTLEFGLWLLIYALTPLVVPFLYWRNHSHAVVDMEESDVRFPSTLRWLLALGASLGVAVFIFMFIRPSLLIGLTPWKLTELTARIFCGWSMLTLFTVLTIARDGRWSAARYLVQSAIVGLGLAVLSLQRMWPDFDTKNPMTYLFVAGIVLAFFGLIVLHFRMDGVARHRPGLLPKMGM